MRISDWSSALCSSDLQRLEARVEGRVAAQRGIDRQRPGGERRRKAVGGAEQAVQGEGGGDLGAVQQGEAFLGGERDGLDAALAEHFPRRSATTHERRGGKGGVRSC